MRWRMLGLLTIPTVAALGFAVLWFWGGGPDSHDDAEATLARLSRQSGDQTYYARYEGPDLHNPNLLASITIFNKPRVGFRFELPSPVAPDSDAEESDDVLKSGDILIVNLNSPAKYISCRTVRRSCRTADGLERLAIVSFLTLFRFDEPFLAQPHSVSRTDDLVAVGETAKCFVISPRTAHKNEQATVEAGGFVSDRALPKTVCYTNEGIPLGGLVSDSPANTNWIKAVELKREVDNAAFEPPFPIVPSVYDRTPTAQPPATPTGP